MLYFINYLLFMCTLHYYIVIIDDNHSLNRNFLLEGFRPVIGFLHSST